MIKYFSGSLLESSAEALVNTVNCEGYMRKGIAYQFKMTYPENNKSYVKACKSGNLVVGKMHYFKERDKLIINFPTKDKWRAKSRMKYIIDGLIDLKALIVKKNIKTIAIPPLGTGNGGLIWNDVKLEIEKKLSDLPNNIEIFIYEPSQNYKPLQIQEPQLSTSALVLMLLKKHLEKFDSLRLQKSAYIMDISSGSHYFNFKRYKYGPYDNTIAIISKQIKEYQKYYNVKSTEEAYNILYKKLVSDKVERKLEELKPHIIRSTNFVNLVKTNSELECIATVLYLVEEQKFLNQDEIIKAFREWSKDKAERFSEMDITIAIHKLNENNILAENLMGYFITK